jgi:hypothetical protein
LRRSGWILVLTGVLGIVFFLLTDPRYGPLTRPAGNPVDAANEAFWGTAVGVAGSAVVLLIGLWLTLRRSV